MRDLAFVQGLLYLSYLFAQFLNFFGGVLRIRVSIYRKVGLQLLTRVLVLHADRLLRIDTNFV